MLPTHQALTMAWPRILFILLGFAYLNKEEIRKKLIGLKTT
jgi:hypothetical protein